MVFFLSPAWAHHHGMILNKDVTSEYSLIMPIFFDKMMALMGGFNYVNAVGIIMIGLSAIYYFLLYGFWRYWMGSFSLGFFAVMYPQHQTAIFSLGRHPIDLDLSQRNSCNVFPFLMCFLFSHYSAFTRKASAYVGPGSGVIIDDGA